MITENAYDALAAEAERLRNEVERLKAATMTREKAMVAFDLIPKPKVEVRTLDFGGGNVTHQVCINHLHLIAREFYPDWSEEDAHQVVCNINHALGITEGGGNEH